MLTAVQGLLPRGGIGVQTGPVARGEHPQRTAFYGVVLIAAALVGSTVATYHGPTWLRWVVYALALPAALIGVVMSLRDRS